MTIYLDNAGTKKPDEKIAGDYLNLIKKSYGNSSSLHSHGREMSKILENCREKIACLFSVEPDIVYFNSGASEGNNTILKGMVDYALFYKTIGKKLPHLIISSIEHPSIIESAKILHNHKRAEVTFIHPEKDGLFKPEKIIDSIKAETILISVGFVNNETGVVQDVKKIGRELKKYKSSIGAKYPYLHTDITQAIEYNTINLERDLIDIVTFSGHKFGSLPGTGVLISKTDKFFPLISGGGQEMDKRSGTVDVYGIYYLVKVLENIAQKRIKNTKILQHKKGKLEQGIEKIEGAKILFKNSPRSPHISLIALKNIEHQNLFVILDKQKISVSIGSACASKSQKISYVLKNMQVDAKTIRETARKFNINFGSGVSREDSYK